MENRDSFTVGGVESALDVLPLEAVFSVRTRVEDGLTVVAASGELDIAARAPFIECAEAAVSGNRRMAIDLTEVTFLDSCGIEGLLRISNLVNAAGGQLTLRGATRQVRRVLEITGLLERLSVAP